MTNKATFYDGNNHCIRAIGGYAFRAANGEVLKTSDGVETAMLLGSINTFFALQRKFKPTHTAFAFDAGRSKHRLAIRSAYKSNRDAVAGPVETYGLIPQLELFRAFLDVVGVPHFTHAGIEADDILATLAHDYEGHSIVISADHDLQQLASEDTSVFKPAIGQTPEKLYTPAVVHEKYGLWPNELPAMWALMGDKGDGIEGIPKVGIKTATKIIQKYTSFGEAVACDPKTAGYEKWVFENKSMIELHPEIGREAVPNEVNLSFMPKYSDELKDFLARYELNSLVRRFDQKKLWD